MDNFVFADGCVQADSWDQAITEMVGVSGLAEYDGRQSRLNVVGSEDRLSKGRAFALKETGGQMRLDLDCGRSVAVDALYYQETYLSLLEGVPNQEINARILERVRSEMVPLWGERPVYVVPPAISLLNHEHPVLPAVRFTAWLTCYQPIKEINAGSELVVVWFREECSDEPLEDIVYDAIRSLSWEELARDFEDW